MKRLALVAVVLVAACSTKETPKADTPSGDGSRTRCCRCCPPRRRILRWPR